MDDAVLMRRALQLGEQGRRTSAPNPWVGCVVARDGRIVGEGYHRRAGESHAEVNALSAAGELARGATAYVTLEPCVHHGRTQPCVDALLKAGIARVVVATPDQDRRVCGRGIAALRAAGVQVDVGVEAAAAEQALAPYTHHRRTGRSYCVLKAAVTLDGRTAAPDGTSQWITGPQARADVHALRADSQAILVGAGTALADRPALTVRDVPVLPAEQPLRVLLDATGRVPAVGPLFDTTLAPTLVATTPVASPPAREAWRRAGAEVLELPAAEDGTGVDLYAVFSDLGRRGILQALVEGGPILHGACLRTGLVNRLILYIGPRSLGAEGRPLFAGAGPLTIAQAADWRLLDLRRLGDDVRLDYEPVASDLSGAPAQTTEPRVLVASGRQESGG